MGHLYSIGFCFLYGIVFVSCADHDWEQERHEANAREGSSARAEFEVVAAGNVSAAASAPGTAAEIYTLDPNRDSFKAKDRALANLTGVTLVWPQGFEASPFVFDLFLHGPLTERDAPAVRVAALDIRKFLPQPVGAESEDVTRLQAYFEELSRKTKLIYGPNATKDAASAGYERARLAAIERDLRQESGSARIARIRALLDAEGSVDLAALEENLRLAVTEPESTEGQERTLAAVKVLGAARKISYVKLVNNCREPGNYEISLDDWLGRPALRGAFTLSPDLYDRLLREYFGLGIREIGTGIRISRSIAWGDPGRYWKGLLPWNWIKHLPRVGIQEVMPPGAGSSRAEGPIKVARGRIPYEDYEIEVRAKSAFQAFMEPLSYVAIDPAKPMPPGFLAPDDSAPSGYWASRRHSGQVVAHKFVSFEDLQRYEVHLSGFEVNGVYVGKTDLVDYDVLRKAGRWRFDYSYLAALDRFELWQDAGGSVWMRLTGDESAGRVSFLIGNLRLRVGEAIEYPFGIGTQPLVSDYNDNVFQATPRVALAYGQDGVVLDHHDTRIGVERAYVERLAPGAYRLRLVAHERILPVWEGVIRAGPPSS